MLLGPITSSLVKVEFKFIVTLYSSKRRPPLSTVQQAFIDNSS